MKIVREIDLYQFEAWGNAQTTIEIIRKNRKERVFEEYIEEFYPDGIAEEELNDILGYEQDETLRMLEIPTEDELREKKDDLEEELEMLQEECDEADSEEEKEELRASMELIQDD